MKKAGQRVRVLGFSLLAFVLCYACVYAQTISPSLLLGNSTNPLSNPYGVSVDSQGNIYVVDTGNNKIKKFSPTGVKLLEFGGTEGTGDGQFRQPQGVAVDSQGNIWVVDTGNSRVQKFNGSGQYQSQLGAEGQDNNQFYLPRDIVVDKNNNIYVCDSGNNRILKFNSSGTPVNSFSGSNALSGFSTPYGVAVDLAANIYVADTSNHCVKKFNSVGTSLQDFGICGQEGSEEGKFSYPQDVAVGSGGYVYVADTYNHRIQKFSSAGEFQTVFGRWGLEKENFFTPQKLSVNITNNVEKLFIVDSNLNRAQVFDFSTQPGVADSSPPTGIATVNDGTGADVDISSSVNTLSANWTESTDEESGIKGYRYTIYSMEGDCIDGTSGCSEADDSTLVNETDNGTVHFNKSARCFTTEKSPF